jgi:hypothetical protein
MLKTTNTDRCILFTKNHIVDPILAEFLQLTDIINQLYDLMSIIDSIQLDTNEFVALKVIILLSPGIYMNKEPTRLKDEQRVQRTQEDIIDALYTYTSSNYKDFTSKYGEILTLCSYVTNVSIHFKTYLFHKIKEVENNLIDSQASTISNFGLLMELLKGDLIFQPNYSLN